jgi:hypothetical protein
MIIKKLLYPTLLNHVLLQKMISAEVRILKRVLFHGIFIKEAQVPTMGASTGRINDDIISNANKSL